MLKDTLPLNVQVKSIKLKIFGAGNDTSFGLDTGQCAINRFTTNI